MCPLLLAPLAFRQSFRQTLRARSAAAAHYRVQELQTSRDPQDAMEAARDLVEADEPERAAEVASHVGSWMRQAGHAIALAAFAGEILASIPLRSPAAQGLAQLEADANEALGLTPAAERRWREIAAVQAELIAVEPDRADYQRDLRISYERLEQSYVRQDRPRACGRCAGGVSSQR